MLIRFRKSLFPLLDYQNIIITIFITIITIPIIIMIIAPMIIVKFRQRMALPLPSLPERGRGFSHSILHTLAPGTYFFTYHYHHHSSVSIKSIDFFTIHSFLHR